jgi:hypothetical protein
MLASCKDKAATAPSADASAADVVAVVASPCGSLPCETFDTDDAAFGKLIAGGPVVIGVGETHAQKDHAGPSTTKRFTDEALPLFKGKASDLVLELWVANGSCGKREKEVATKQKEVTAPQAETNQNEFVALGNAAKASGIEPHVLMPNCDEYAKILDAGAGDIDAMLTMIGDLSADRIERARKLHPDKIVVAYGGALHNDLFPRPGHEAWAYGPRIAKATGDKYVEVDLIEPEAIGDTAAWKDQPWYADYHRDAQKDKAVLMTVKPSSYVLFLKPL